jgi:hypothetical protein
LPKLRTFEPSSPPHPAPTVANASDSAAAVMMRWRPTVPSSISDPDRTHGRHTYHPAQGAPSDGRVPADARGAEAPGASLRIGRKRARIRPNLWVNCGSYCGERRGIWG